MLIGSSNPTYVTNTSLSNINSGTQSPTANVENTEYRQVIADNTESINHDFTNMSPNEYSELVKSGEIKREHFILAFPAGGLDVTGDINAQMEAASDVKIDYVAFIQERIDYNKSVNLPTDIYDNMLNEIDKAQQRWETPKVNIYA